MFEPSAWDEEEGPKLSALTYSQVQSKNTVSVINSKKDDCGKKASTKKRKKSDGKTTKEKSKRVFEDVMDATTQEISKISSVLQDQHRNALREVDKIMNSPSASKCLMDSDSDDCDGEDAPKKKNGKKRMTRKASEGALQKQFSNAKELFVEASGKIQRAMSTSVIPSKTENESGKHKKSVFKENVEAKGAESSESNDATNNGNILTKGIKFSSQDAFLKFVGKGGKNKRGKKRKPDTTGDEVRGTDNDGYRETPTKQSVVTLEEEDNVFEDKADEALEEEPPVPPPRKKKATHSSNGSSRADPLGINMDKLREVLKDQETSVEGSVKSSSSIPKKTKKSIGDTAKDKLSAARFRYLNEQLYSQPASQSFKIFSKDEDLFRVYHAGYQQQTSQWPVDPLNVIIASIMKLPETHVIADMGCGEGRLSRSVPNVVHSFDMVSVNPGVTACEMSNTPLKEGEVDVVVFSLSLMGTNIRDFIYEATRILKMGGVLKIAELESRFQETYSADQFISDLEKFGLKNTWKDLKREYFYFMDFKKVAETKKKKKLPEINLKPCFYKKR